MVIAEWVDAGSKEYKEADEGSNNFVTHVLHSPCIVSILHRTKDPLLS
jgi:predicted alpha/beta hydrolase family esterase